MRAVIARRGSVSVETVDEPTPGPGQVLVASRACGICGSDLHTVAAQADAPDVVPPLSLGHEFVAEVLDYGPNTERTHPVGTLVTSVPYVDTPEGPQLVGLAPTLVGGLAERFLLQESRILAVPKDIAAPEHAALAEPLAVGAHAAAIADMQPGDVSLVVGCGPVGLAVVASLKARGFGPVVAADFSANRRALAERVGADVVIDPADRSPYTAWRQLAGPSLPSSPMLTAAEVPNTVVFECVGVPGMLAAVMQEAPVHSRVVVVGVCMQPDTILPMIGTAKELTLKFAFAYRPEEFAAALDWIATGRIDVGPLITATLPIDEAATAFEALRQPDEHCKILLLPSSVT